MLTRKDLKEFKESVRKDNDAIIKVGSGETVTVSYLWFITNLMNSLLKYIFLNNLGSGPNS